MLVVLAVLCPPLAVLLTAGSVEAVKSIGLTLLLYVPGVVHALRRVDHYNANRQYDSLMRVLDSRAGPVSRRVA